MSLAPIYCIARMWWKGDGKVENSAIDHGFPCSTRQETRRMDRSGREKGDGTGRHCRRCLIHIHIYL